MLLTEQSGENKTPVSTTKNKQQIHTNHKGSYKDSVMIFKCLIEVKNIFCLFYRPLKMMKNRI